MYCFGVANTAKGDYTDPSWDAVLLRQPKAITPRIKIPLWGGGVGLRVWGLGVWVWLDIRM